MSKIRAIKLNKLFKLYATFSVAFLLSLTLSSSAFPLSSVSATSPSTISGSDTAPVSVSVSNSPLAYYISVSSSHGSAGTPVSLNYSQDGSTGGILGNVVSSSDNVYLETNSPLTHQLLLSTSGTHSESTIPSSIVANNLTGTNTKESSGSLITNTYIAPIGNTTTSSLNSATALSNNTWGFALSSTTPGIATNNFNTASEYESESQATINSNRYTTVPTSGNEVLLTQDTNNTSSTTIYYGVKADRDIPAGSYSNTVLYTALAEQPSEIRVCVTDTSGSSPVTTCGNGTGSSSSSTIPTIDVSNPSQTVKIYTSISTTDENLGTATVNISSLSSDDTTCANPTLSLENNYIVATCTAPNLTAGTYNVTLTLSKYGRVLSANSSLKYENRTQNAFSEANLVYLQQMTNQICNNANNGDTFTLKDTRDDKAYSIAKLADDNCWMTQNLALDGGITLTPSDSDVTTNRTLPANITDGTTSQYDVAQIYSGVAEDTTSQAEVDASGYPYAIASPSKYGNLYNWNAATATVGKQATTGTVYESVCPKGWRLPDNGTATGDKTYANLVSGYSYINDQGAEVYLSTTNIIDGHMVERIQGSPLNFALSGFYASQYLAKNNFGVYWSRTNLDSVSSGAWYFHYTANVGHFHPQDATSDDKNQGFSVRCVYGENSSNIMQNFTTANCTALTTSTASAPVRKLLQDSRDGKLYNVSKLADGNCWMTSNLALDGMDDSGNIRTLTTADSDVATNRTLARNINIGTATAVNVPQIYSGSASYATTSCVASAPYCVVNATNLYGNLYNWNAATATVGKNATVGTVTESVCPKGWRIPDSGSASKTWTNLIAQYGLAIGGTDGNSVMTMQQAPLYFTLAGVYVDSGYGNRGVANYYWSRKDTLFEGGDGFSEVSLMFATSGYYWSRHGLQKELGLSVRCVFGS